LQVFISAMNLLFPISQGKRGFDFHIFTCDI
jgi:hypothetical protein